jgi:pimeloyl-ACP methyl ester carboxylesterase
MSATAPEVGYLACENKKIDAANGTTFVYRDLGGSEVPLVLLQHFRGNLENWDPVLIDALAQNRRVITFDNTGVGGSSGETPHTIAEMADDATLFLEALELGEVDLLGFSIGSFVAQEVTLTRPGLVRRIVLASSAPQGAAGMHGWAKEVIDAVGVPQPALEGVLSVFYAPSAASQEAGKQSLQRIYGARTEDRDIDTTWQTRQAQYDAVCSWGVPNHALLQRVSAIEHPVFIANGDSDPMILPHYSYLLAGLIPQAKMKIYPDSAHGFLFQHAAEFAADVEGFLSE